MTLPDDRPASLPHRSEQPTPAADGNGLDITQPAGDIVEENAAKLVEILDQYLAELKQGKQPSRDALLAKHPQLAEPLRGYLAGLEFIHREQPTARTPKSLGDFQIIREIGRGGMGAVYEAEQKSLGRRVALKILRFGSSGGSESVERFTREAETVARLHHTNIVPIFAVGCEEGVNYYAMQFIEGQSLDQVLNARRQQGESISPETVAQWGLQAAEALTHAHARGVIHRDVKPSNLLLDDEEGRIWLTDFGLAKRLDDVTLSMTGALLGTPRYMSPEQADASHLQLDHRTDIYSLGASLYELATGQPVFAGHSPHDVIRQIMTAEPVPARKLVESLPRDLDTIIMKCLAKEVSQRYESARSLANDLRAFQEGRPIAARRVRLIERTSRWVKRQRRSVTLAAVAVAATLLLVLGTLLGTYAWQRSRIASVMLKTDHPPLVAQLMQDGRVVVPPITVPTQQKVEVPAGQFQMHLLSDGRLSQFIDLELQPGESRIQELSLDDQLLWKDLPIESTYRVVPSLGPSQSDSVSAGSPKIVELTNEGITAIGASGQPLWTLNLKEPTDEIFKDGPQLIWPWNQFNGGYHSKGLGEFDQRPWVTSHPGSNNLLLTARHQGWIVAINGDDGVPRWIVSRGDSEPQPNRAYQLVTSVVEPPKFIDDRNGDGQADLLAMFIDKNGRQPAERWIELISGSDGQTIWRYDLSSELFALEPGEQIPRALQWVHTVGGSSSGGSFLTQLYYKIREPPRPRRIGESEYLPSGLQLISATGEVRADAGRLTTVCGKQIIELDLSTGTLIAAVPVTLPFRPATPPRHGDLDGDRQSDFLFLESLPDVPSPQGTSYSTPQTRVVAWSAAKQAPLWTYDIQASLPLQADVDIPIPAWPLVVDLDGDGVCEVIVPEQSSDRGASTPPWGRMVVLDGGSGQPRWKRQLYNVDGQLDHFLVGPDIDDDGVREVFAATQWQLDLNLFVDCFSGKDGHSLWHLEQPPLISENEWGEFRVADLRWYDTGGDGWPQLVVQLRQADSVGASDRALFVSAGTGAMMHFAPAVAQVDIADLDSDGVDDLLLWQRNDVQDLHKGGKLQAFRGVVAECWRRQISPQVVVGDLDGDGIGDCLPHSIHRTLTARSGADGRVLWQQRREVTPLDSNVYPLKSSDPRLGPFSPSVDLNTDGVPDFVVSHPGNAYHSLLTAISGKSGRRLWGSEFQSHYRDHIALVDCRDLDGDKAVEIIVIAQCDFGQSEQTLQGRWRNDPQLWLAVIDGRDGRTRWTKPLCEIQPNDNTKNFELRQVWLEAGYGDLNGDGTLEILLPAQLQPGSDLLAMQAFDGRDGSLHWTFPLPPFHHQRGQFGDVIPATVVDTDGDGHQEVVVLAFDPAGSASANVQRLTMTLLRGSDGKPNWNWHTSAIRYQNEIQNDPDRIKHRLRPLVVRRENGARWIALAVRNETRQIHVVDQNGQSVSTRLNQGVKGFDGNNRLWVVDADGDQQDEIVFSSSTELSLLPPDALERPIWTRAKSETDFQEVIGLLPDPDVLGPLVVLSGDNGFSLRGLELNSGRTEWVCPGPAASNWSGRKSSHLATLLNSPNQQLPPHVMYQIAGPVIVRQAKSFDSDSQQSDSKQSDTWRRITRATATTTPIAADSRLRRPLPWKPSQWSLEGLGPAIAWSSFYGLTLAVVPALFLFWVFQHRQWGLKTLLVLPIVAALMMTAALVRPESPEFATLENRIMMAIAMSPVFFALMILVRWWMQRRRKIVGGWLIAATAICLGAGAFILFVSEPGRSAPFQPGERYDWDGWYYGLLSPLYITCLLLCSTFVVARATRMAWRFLRRSKRADRTQFA